MFTKDHSKNIMIPQRSSLPRSFKHTPAMGTPEPFNRWLTSYHSEFERQKARQPKMTNSMVNKETLNTQTANNILSNSVCQPKIVTIKEDESRSNLKNPDSNNLSTTKNQIAHSLDPNASRRTAFNVNLQEPRFYFIRSSNSSKGTYYASREALE